MKVLRITFSDEAATAAQGRAAEGGFDSVDSYVRGLIEADVAAPVSAALEAELLAGLDGVGRVLSTADWMSGRRDSVVQRRTPRQ